MKAYENYKLRWMINHGYSLTDLVKELQDCQDEWEDMTVTQLFECWEKEIGFHSEIWACESEWEKYRG